MQLSPLPELSLKPPALAHQQFALAEGKRCLDTL
jgi:hypothetical protein